MNVFDKIYKHNTWIFGSGSGSVPINNKPYIEFLKNLLKEKQIKSVVDIGCGDWQLAKTIDWNDIKYLGVDTVKSVIKNNHELYGSKNIKFIHKNILEYTNLPDADLCIIKDVFQHLSNKSIKKILDILNSRNLKYILVVNDVTPLNLNYDIKEGGYRPIDLTKNPFNLKLNKSFSYYEPFYIIVYTILLTVFIYLSKTIGYKLYYIVLLLLILVGIFMFPKKTGYVISNNTL